MDDGVDAAELAKRLINPLRLYPFDREGCGIRGRLEIGRPRCCQLQRDDPIAVRVWRAVPEMVSGISIRILPTKNP